MARGLVGKIVERLGVGTDRLRLLTVRASPPSSLLLLAILPINVISATPYDIAKRLTDCIERQEFGPVSLALSASPIDLDHAPAQGLNFLTSNFTPTLASLKLQLQQPTVGSQLAEPVATPSGSMLPTASEPTKCIRLANQPDKYHRISPEQGGSTKTFDITLEIVSNDARERALGDQNRRWLASATLCYWDTKEEIPDALDGMTSAPFIDGKAKLKAIKIRHEAYTRMVRQSHQVFMKFWIHYNARLGESIPLHYPAEFWKMPIESEPFVVGTYTKAKYQQKERVRSDAAATGRGDTPTNLAASAALQQHLQQFQQLNTPILGQSDEADVVSALQQLAGS
eukprot:TRINITY_DN4660_c0_g1_i1.p1 TRINITY_DN4660_c0_g1~~TRINITY_DN4660_c0_g1_i1.p1  ORF type:complete len:341 (-),score=157.25 TRINITY_DN4660_c0_g1_i1:487-1509(-)